MTAPRLVVELDRNEDIETHDDEGEEEENHNVKKREAGEKEEEEMEESEKHKVWKRQVGRRREGQIETAVFVDDKLYSVVRDANPKNNTENTVKDLVFTIMNGVRWFAFG